jgi:hypothetical protein
MSRTALQVGTTLALCFGLWLSGPTRAAQQGIYIASPVDCAQWIKAREAKDSEVYKAYVLGTVNGLALASGIDVWGIIRIDPAHDQFFFWVDNYCRTKPLSDLIGAAVGFMDEATAQAYTRWKSKQPSP